MLTFYHVTHRCGHQAWWSDSNLAARTMAFDCPWCGAETKNQMPPLGPVRGGDGTLILPSLDLPADTSTAGDEVLVIHLADDSCCTGSIISKASRLN